MLSKCFISLYYLFFNLGSTLSFFGTIISTRKLVSIQQRCAFVLFRALVNFCILIVCNGINRFLIKLLTEDLPRLFVRPKKIVLDFQKGKAVGPVPDLFKSADVQEKNKDSVGELSVTLVDARNLSYVLYGMCFYLASILVSH